MTGVRVAFILDINAEERMFEVSVREIDESPRGRAWAPVFEQMPRDAKADDPAPIADDATEEQEQESINGQAEDDQD